MAYIVQSKGPEDFEWLKKLLQDPFSCMRSLDNIHLPTHCAAASSSLPVKKVQSITVCLKPKLFSGHQYMFEFKTDSQDPSTSWEINA